MPAPSTLALFALAALALIAIPGPNMVYVATRSMSEGRRSGLASALGLETGTIVHVCAAAAGLSALIASSATAFNALRYLGAAYLVYLGVKALVQRRPADAEQAPRTVSLPRAYRQAIVVQLLNPKVALFFLAFLPQFVDPGRGPVWTQVLVLGAILGGLGFLMDCLYAIVSAAAAGRLERKVSSGGKVTGTVYLVLGAAAALTGGRH
jgi:threonine/homoserine/homoserine lactone efflux protein